MSGTNEGRKPPITVSGPLPTNPLDWPIGNTRFGGVNQSMTLREFLTMGNRKPAHRARTAALDLIERLQATVAQQNEQIAALTAMDPVAKPVGGEVEKLRVLAERMIGFIEGLTIISEASPEFLQEQADAYRASLAAAMEGKKDAPPA